MTQFEPDQNAPIYMEFATEPGGMAVDVGIAGIDEFRKKSEEAVNAAMNTIYNMARRTAATIGALDLKPSEIEVSFGIKATAKTGAMISVVTEGGGEVSVNVKLAWKLKE